MTLSVGTDTTPSRYGIAVDIQDHERVCLQVWQYLM